MLLAHVREALIWFDRLRMEPVSGEVFKNKSKYYHHYSKLRYPLPLVTQGHMLVNLTFITILGSQIFKDKETSTERVHSSYIVKSNQNAVAS